MNDLYKKNGRKRTILWMIALAIVFLIINYFVPLTGDDWQNYGNGKFGFINVLRNAKAYYLGWEGRIASRILIFLLTYNKLIWNIFSSLLLVLLVYYMSKVAKLKFNIKSLSIIVLSLLLTNYNMFVEIFFWIAGNLTYLVPTSLFVFYLYYIFNLKKVKDNKIIKIVMTLLTFGMCLFVENIAAAILFANCLLFISKFIKTKKIDLYYVIQIFASLLGILILILSPGTMARMSEYSNFKYLSLLQKIISNIPNFIRYTFLFNPISLLLLILSYDYILFKYSKNKMEKSILFLTMNIIPIFTFIASINQIGPFTIPIFEEIAKSLLFFTRTNSFIILYWIGFIIIYLLTLLLIYKQKDKYNLLFLFLTAISSTGAMMLTPVWSYRVSFFATILFTIMSLSILKDKIDNSKAINVFSIFTIIYVILLVIIYFNVNRNIDYQVSQIKNQINNNKSIVEFYDIPDRLLLSSYPYNDGYKLGYNDVYKIETDVVYDTIICKYDYQIFFNKKNCIK